MENTPGCSARVSGGFYSSVREGKEGRKGRTHHERPSPLGVDRLALRDRHGAVGPPVVRALHADDVLPPRDLPRHLERALDRLGAAVPEEERVERGVGHDREEALDEAEVGLVQCDAALYDTVSKRL